MNQHKSRTKYLLVIMIVSFTALLAIFRYYPRQTNETDAAPNEPSISNSVNRPNDPLATERGRTRRSVPLPRSKTVSLSSEEKQRIAVEEMNVPIHFWGKIVDENEVPLVGVKIKAHVRTWQLGVNLSPSGHFPQINTATGVDGGFEIQNAKGDVITIDALEKEGYEAEPSGLRGFGYNTSENITPNPNDPIIFRMWKKGIKESLVTGEKSFYIVPDGRVYRISFAKGTVAESTNADGDLDISMKRSPDAKIGQKYDWSFTVQPVNGGILEEVDKYSSMFLAPIEGYDNAYKRNYLASERGWSDGAGDKQFYIKTQGGQVYGRIALEVYSIYGTARDQGRLWIKYVVNPSGSRILR